MCCERACVCVCVCVDDWVRKLNNRPRASGVTHHISAVVLFSSSAGNPEVQSLRTGKEGRRQHVHVHDTGLSAVASRQDSHMYPNVGTSPSRPAHTHAGVRDVCSNTQNNVKCIVYTEHFSCTQMHGGLHATQAVTNKKKAKM